MNQDQQTRPASEITKRQAQEMVDEWNDTMFKSAKQQVKASRAIARRRDPHGYLDELVKSAGEEARQLREALEQFDSDNLLGLEEAYWALYFAARDLEKTVKRAQPLIREVRKQNAQKSQG